MIRDDFFDDFEDDLDFEHRRDDVVRAGQRELARIRLDRRRCPGCEGTGWQYVLCCGEWMQTACGVCGGRGWTREVR